MDECRSEVHVDLFALVVARAGLVVRCGLFVVAVAAACVVLVGVGVAAVVVVRFGGLGEVFVDLSGSSGLAVVAVRAGVGVFVVVVVEVFGLLFRLTVPSMRVFVVAGGSVVVVVQLLFDGV